MDSSQNSYNFKILSGQQISKNFLSRNIADFEGAANFIRHLPYRRNADKNNLATLFTEGCGTCGTKHALLKQLAVENSAHDVKLKLGIFKMKGSNTPAVAATLKKHELDYIPEAHNYIVIGNDILDCTRSNSKKEDFINHLLIELDIESNQITEYKVTYHKNYLEQWLKEQELPLSLEQLWMIREQCISDLSK